MSVARDAYLQVLGITRWQRRAGTGQRGEGAAADAAPAASSPAVATAPPVTRRPAPAAVAAVSKDSTPDAAGGRSLAPRVGVVPGPGKGSCLYLCGAGDDTDSALASDLARVLPEAPVWGRLAAGEATGERLEALIAERLFTQVVVFGEAQAELLFEGDVPAQCGPARVTVAPGLDRLASDPTARRRCWFALKSAGCVARA